MDSSLLENTLNTAMNTPERLSALCLAVLLALPISSVHAQSLDWNLPGSGAWDTATANWTPDGGTTTTTFASDGTVDVNFNTGSDATITIAPGMNPASTTANPSGGTLQFSGGPIAGAGGLTKSGSGVLRLNGENSFTGKTVIQGGRLELWSSALLSNAGANGALGAPSGANAVIDMYNGSTLKVRQTGGSTQSTDRTIDLVDPAGAGTVTIQFNGNDCFYTLGEVTATGDGAKLLDLYTGVDGNGDREVVTINGPISDVTGDGSPLSLRVAYRTQTNGADSFFNLPGSNTFTGDIELTKGSGALRTGYFTVGGVRTNGGSTPGSGTLGGGSYPGDIAVGAQTVFNYLSSASQTLSGVISGTGTVNIDGGGTVTLAGASTLSGNIDVKSGSTFELADDAGVTFHVTDPSVNKITGNGTTSLNGDFTIDTSAVTVPAGSWTLVDVASATYGGTFTVAGAGWSESSDVWTKVDGISTWTFTEATGTLTLSSDAVITSFSYAGLNGTIDNDALAVTLWVAKGTDLADVAPSFTLTSGSCDQPNGAAPTPSFASSNPVTYTVTDGSTVNAYTVTVVEASGIIHVSAEKSGQESDAGLLEGPGGGLGETWNQVTTNNAGALLDSTGLTTGVGFTVNTDGLDKWNDAPLQMLHAGLRNFGKGSTKQLVITGLTPGDLYDVHIASTQGNFERGKGDWSTPNATTTVGSQSVDSTGNPLNISTWEKGYNHVSFENVEVDVDGEIVLDGVADPAYRLPVNGFQLVPIPPARIVSFEAAGQAGVIDQNALAISVTVPFGTDLSTLAPSFVVNSGSCDQTSGSPPSPTFAAQNPVDYVVTDGATVNTYSVTVTVEPPPPVTTTLVIDLGTSPSGTLIPGEQIITSGPTNYPIPALPAGSILRAIDVDVTLELPDEFALVNDLTLLFDPTPGTPGGDYILGITSPNPVAEFGPPTEVLSWSGGNGGVGTSLVETVTESAWTGDIDLASVGLFLGNTYVANGTWSGTITLTYDQVGGGSAFQNWATGGETFEGDANGDGVQDGLAFLLGAPTPATDASGLLPTVSESGGELVMTFNCLPVAAREGAVLKVEHSSTLGAAPDPWLATADVVPDADDPTADNGVTFVVTPGPTGPPALNSVTATIGSGEAAGGKLFARLVGLETAP